MSTSTGAPAAFARSLGKNDITNGVATATAPMPPTTLVAPIRKRRFPSFTVASAMTTCPPSLPAGRLAVGAGSKPAPNGKPVDYKGFAAPAGSPAPACELNPARNQRVDAALAPTAGLRPRRLRVAASGRGPARLRSAASVYNWPVPVSSRLLLLRRIWLVLRAGLHAVPRRAVRRHDAAAGSRSPRSQRQAGPASCCCRRPRRRSVTPKIATFSDAAKKAMPAVVNIYTSKEMRQRAPARRRSAAPPLLSRSRRAAAAAARDEPGLRRDRLARRLRAHQQSRDRRRRRHPARARRRPPRRRARARHRPRIGPRRAEGRRREPARRSPSARSTACRSATSCSRSATRSASATP